MSAKSAAKKAALEAAIAAGQAWEIAVPRAILRRDDILGMFKRGFRPQSHGEIFALELPSKAKCAAMCAVLKRQGIHGSAVRIKP